MATSNDRALSALYTLNPGVPRADWVRIAMAAKDAGLGLSDFIEWSSNAPNFGTDRECRRLWESIKPGPVTSATLYGMARDMGWKDPGRTAQAPSRAFPACPNRALAFRATKRAVAAPRKPQVDAENLWQQCEPATGTHPYIVRKLGRPEGMKVVPPDSDLRVLGNSVAGWLAIPAWAPEGSLRTVQLIPPEPDRGKLNLPGHPFADGCFWVGDPSTSTRLFVVEGIGQAWAVTAARGGAAVVCFGAGRMSAMAEATRKRFPGISLVIVADRGKEQDAEAIAGRCRAAWVAPPPHKPVNYDVNDLVVEEGPDALCRLLDAPQVPPGRFHVRAMDELLHGPPLIWLVRGVLPAGGLACMYGASGSGKSFLALDLCAAVATGSKWFGRRVTPAPVVYVALEGEQGMRQRARAWQVHNDAPIPEGLRFVMEPLDLRDATDREELARSVQFSGTAGGLVVIDTLNRASGGADENSSRDMGEIIDAAKDLLDRLGGTVLLIHHSGKDQTKGLRGHSSLHAALDAAIEVSRSEARREWRIAKNKDEGDSSAHPFRLHVVELGQDDLGEPVTSCVVVEDEDAQSAKPMRHPQGATQKLAHEELGRLLRESREYGRGGAPSNRPSVDLETAVLEVAKRLTCRPDQRQFQARRAIAAMTAKGMYGVKDGWIWDSQ